MAPLTKENSKLKELAAAVTVPKLCSYVGGILLIALGINLSKTAGLGISPVASIPYAVELIWGIELGTATAMIYVLLILLQLILLRKLSVAVALQFVTTFVISLFTTITSREHLLCWLPQPESYVMSLVMLVISNLFIGVGVYFYIKPSYIPLPAEGLAKTVVEVTGGKIEFFNAKVAVDCGLVLTAVILGLIVLGKVAGVREGTVITALLVGKIVGLCRKLEKRMTEKNG